MPDNTNQDFMLDPWTSPGERYNGRVNQNTTEPKPIPSWDQAYSNATTPEQFQAERQHLAEAQKQPGYVPPGQEAWILDAQVRILKATNAERYQAVRRAQMNGADMASIQKMIRGEA